MSKFSFENLDVYNKSLDLVDKIYKIAGTFPDIEKFNLSSQLIRAITSVSLNIAEGAGESSKEFKRYLNI